jgi:hypothetical protein
VRPAGAPATQTTAAIEIDPIDWLHADVLPTRSGEHLLASHRGTRFILGAADLETVREIRGSPGIVDFDRRYEGIEDHARVLTDDLSFLVKVPFNAGEPQGHDHCKAVAYDVAGDATREITLDLGAGPTGIEDVESLGGALRFLVVHGERRAVVDERSTVVAWLPAKPFGATCLDSILCWDPARERIVAWSQEDLTALTPLRLTDHAYGTGETLSYRLEWGDAAQVLGGP